MYNVKALNIAKVYYCGNRMVIPAHGAVALRSEKRQLHCLVWNHYASNFWMAINSLSFLRADDN